MPTDRRNAAQKLDEDEKPSAIAIAPTPSSAASMRFACAICRSTTNAPTEQPRAVRKLRVSWRTETTQSSARSCRLGLLRIRSEEHTSEIKSLMRISYAVFCLKQKK